MNNSINIVNKQFKGNIFLKKDDFNYDYEGYFFKYKNEIYVSRLAKKTPKKAGYFVTFWKKVNHVNYPYDELDEFDYFVINIIDGEYSGYFVFPKKELIKYGIVSLDKIKGKMGFRVYPSWEINLNSTAARTQKWQLNYFNII